MTNRLLIKKLSFAEIIIAAIIFFVTYVVPIDFTFASEVGDVMKVFNFAAIALPFLAIANFIFLILINKLKLKDTYISAFSRISLILFLIAIAGLAYLPIISTLRKNL